MNTKKIAEYRTLLNVTKTATLKELKTIYRNSIKECHPDKFSGSDAGEQAEAQSTAIIEAYHFLVSIAPETQEKVKDAYENTIKNSLIQDFHMDKGVLYISFYDGSNFEYFGVPKNIYSKMVNSESPGRFARRYIYTNYLYRSATKLEVA